MIYINLICLARHMVWYIQLLWFVIEFGRTTNRKTDEEHDDYCVEEGFHLAIVKFNRHAKEGREALRMRYCSINT